MTDQNYDEMNVTQLRDAASNADIPGRSSMNADELRDALKANAADETPDAVVATTVSPQGVPEDTGAVHESHTGTANVGGQGVGFDGVEEGEAARVDADAQMQTEGESPDVSMVMDPGAPGPQLPRSAAADPNAKYGQPGE